MVVGLLVLILPQYCLSYGPAIWLERRGVIDAPANPVWLVYWPLEEAARRSPAAEGILYWYLHFWDPLNY